MKLREIEDYGLKILTEKAKDGSMTVYAKFGEAEKRNQNFRIYPLEILLREVNRVQAKIASGQFLGQADHGDSPATFLKNVSHVVTGLEMKGNEGYATIKILNTDAGKNCQEIIRGKGRIGISTRSVGTVDAKTGRIQSDLRLLALDLVSNPSVKDATIGKENILEGLNFEEENTEDKMKGLSAAPVQQRVKLADVYYEAQAAGIDPQTYCDRINANIDRQEALESEPDFTAQEVASILEEGRKAGIDITDPEERKRILNIAREQKKQPEALTEEETFIRFAVNKGLNERTAKLLWSKIQKEKKQVAKAQSLFDEKVVAGFGSESRPESRRISKKIIGE